MEPPPDAAKAAEPGTEPAGSTTATPGAPAEPAPLLRTDTADDAEVARKVRETLGRANTNLNKANYNNLGAGAKGQYDTARRFIAQAEEALKGRSLTFARYLADKAETLSASLLNRWLSSPSRICTDLPAASTAFSTVGPHRKPPIRYLLRSDPTKATLDVGGDTRTKL